MDYNEIIKTHEEMLETLNKKMKNFSIESQSGQIFNIQKMIKEELNIINSLGGFKTDKDINDNNIIKKEKELKYFQNFKNCMILNKKESNDDDIKILSCDIGIATGKNKDNVYYHIGTYNKDNDRRKSVIFGSFITETKDIANAIYNIFIENRCNYLLFDLKGIGTIFYDNFVEKDLIALDDKFLNVSDEIYIENLRKSHDCFNKKEVIIPFLGTRKLYNNMYISLNKNLNDYNILLQNDNNTNEIYELLQKCELLIEADCNIKIQAPRDSDKGSFINLCMFNYFCDKLKDYYDNNKNIIGSKELPFKILIGERGSRITTSLLSEAKMTNGTYVCFTKGMINHIKSDKKLFDFKDVKIVSFNELNTVDKNERLFIDLLFSRNIRVDNIINKLKEIGVPNIDKVSTVGIGTEHYLENLFSYLKVGNKVILRKNNKIGKISEINYKYVTLNINSFNKFGFGITILFEDETTELIKIEKILNHTCEECIEEHFKKIGNKKFKDTLD